MTTDVRAWQPDAAARPASPARAPSAGHTTLAGLLSRLGRSKGRVRPTDVVLMISHLATLLDAGLQLSKALRTVARQVRGTALGGVVTKLADEVQGGNMLSSAMAQRPDVFDSLTINVVRAGEAGGTLPKTLGQLADDMENKQALRRAVVGALVYPIIVLSIAAVVVGFVLVYVVPVFEGVYTKMKLDLPWITQLLLAASRTVLGGWWALLLGIAAAVAGFRALRRAERFRLLWDTLMLRVPLVGVVRCKAMAARFLSAFSTLIGSGVSIVETLRLMTRITSNSALRQAVEDIQHHVSRGGRMSDLMERHADLFSPMAVQMICVGEQTGTLPESAERAAEFLAKEVEARVKTLTTLLEPLLTVGLGVVVGAIALAIYLPMFDLMKHVSQ